MRCPFVIKVCSKCKRILVANEINFGKHKKYKYGLRSVCKKCRKNEHYNKEKKKKYYAEHKEESVIYHKRYYQNNKGEIIEKSKEYYREHKEEIREKKKQYYEDNPDIFFNNNNKRRLIENNQGNGITKEQWLEMMNFFEWKCAYSGEYLGGKPNENIRSIDHIVPLSKGGDNEIWNCVPMLKSYNSSKHTSDMLEWYTQQDFYSEERLNRIYEWVEYAKKKWYIN